MELGDEVKCIITDFVGIVTAVCYHLNGDVEYALVPRSYEGTKYPETVWLSGTRLTKTGKKVTTNKVEKLMGFKGVENGSK